MNTEEIRCERCGCDVTVEAIHGSTSLFVKCPNCGFNWIEDNKEVKQENTNKTTKQFLRG